MARDRNKKKIVNSFITTIPNRLSSLSMLSFFKPVVVMMVAMIIVMVVVIVVMMIVVHGGVMTVAMTILKPPRSINC